jgi:hypothetical protein
MQTTALGRLVSKARRSFLSSFGLAIKFHEEKDTSFRGEAQGWKKIRGRKDRGPVSF